MSAAREVMLRRIRTALSDVPATEQPVDVVVQRNYRTTVDLPHEALLDLFIERVDDYNATISRTTEASLPAAIAAAIAARNITRLITPPGLPRDWIPDGVTLLPDEALTHAQLADSDGVLTGCTLGIAETGTIILCHGPLEGRRAITLVPDYHLCIVRTAQIVASVPEAITLLQDHVRQRSPITFISGPSATSDIELRRVHGVHGPRTLDVLVIA